MRRRGSFQSRLLFPISPLGAAVGLILLAVAAPLLRRESQKAKPAIDGQNQGQFALSSWKTLEIQNKVVLRVPPDMKPLQLPGDAIHHREGYRNRAIQITILGDLLIPEMANKLREQRFYSCDTPDYFLRRPNYHESILEIDKKKAKLGIDLGRPPGDITARLCFPSADDESFELLIVATCQDVRALETVKQIFNSISFKDNR